MKKLLVIGLYILLVSFKPIDNDIQYIWLTNYIEGFAYNCSMCYPRMVPPIPNEYYTKSPNEIAGIAFNLGYRENKNHGK